MNFLNKFGFARMIAKQNAVGYGAGGVIGVILVPDSDESFLWAGRMMERVWLTLVANGYSMHLITGLFFFYQKIVLGDGSLFSPEHQKIIRQAYERVSERFEVRPDQVIALYFRLGRADPPSATSPKLPPVIEYQ